MLNDNSKTDKRWICDVEDAGDGTGDLILQFPQELCDHMGWKEGTILKFEGRDGNIYVTEKKDESI